MTESASEATVRDNQDVISRLEQRRRLYPGLYKTNEELQLALEKYAVVDVADFRKRPRLDSSWQRLENANGDSVAIDDTTATQAKEEITEEGPLPATSSTTAPETQTPIYSNADIWGNIPPREPKYLVECQICNRQVAVSRFAPHLDKCMLLGSMRGAAGNASSRGASTRP